MILGSLLVLAVQAAPGPQDPLRDWSYQRKEINPRTGQEEVTAIIGGAEAVPVDLTPKREILEVRKVKARYFTEPRRPGEDSVEVRIEAERGRMDNAARTLRILEGVRVRRVSDGALLETREALLRFPLRYVCVPCDPRRDAPARCPGCAAPLAERADRCAACALDLRKKSPSCPACGAALKDRTFTSVEVPGGFSFSGPEGVLRGEGLDADDALGAIRVARNGYVEVVGNPGDPARAAAARPRVAQLACRGPLTIEESAPEARTRIRAREAVRMDRIDESGTTTARADEADIVLVRTPTGPQVRELRARGRVDLDSVSFAEGRGMSVRGDALDWEHRDLSFWSEDAARIEGSPAEAKVGPQVVRSRRMTLRGPEGWALFEGEVNADLLPPAGGPAAQRVTLESERLFARASSAAAGGWDLRDVEATGRVVISGLLPGAAGRAEAERFRWDLAAGRGILESPRFVRVVRGANRILAPRVVVEDAGETVILKGPKEIVFLQPSPQGPPEEVRATAEGDVVLHSGAGRIRMERACAIRTRDFRVSCDRVDALLGEGGAGLRSLRAAGKVRADRPGDGVVLYGDRMTYDPVRRELELFGSPFAVADGNRMVSYQERLVFYERENGKPGESVRFMEMRRGSGTGIRIRLGAPAAKE